MTLRTKAVWSLAAAFCFALLCAAPVGAQTVTTGNITGSVTDAQGGVLPGASVTAVHTDTDTSYEAVTGGDGRYSILNVRVGPYTVTATLTASASRRGAGSGSAWRQQSRESQVDRHRSAVEVVANALTIDLAPARPTTPHGRA
jgi:hypothetical protein